MQQKQSHEQRERTRFGQTLRDCRAALMVDVWLLGRLLKVRPRLLVAYEWGERIPTVELVDRICAVCKFNDAQRSKIWRALAVTMEENNARR